MYFNIGQKFVRFVCRCLHHKPITNYQRVATIIFDTFYSIELYRCQKCETNFMRCKDSSYHVLIGDARYAEFTEAIDNWLDSNTPDHSITLKIVSDILNRDMIPVTILPGENK